MSTSSIPRSILPARAFAAWAALVALAACAPVSAAPDYTKVVGPSECVECHKVENEIWKGTHHFKTFREMPRSDDAKKIAEALGLKRIKRESLCLDCHFTSTDDGGKPKPIAGISCESCHSAGKDWAKRHGEYSGKKKETETEAEAAERWKDAEAGGMIRPHMLYAWAKNCYGCHVVPNEKLVNVGEHPAGSKFELVSWSQGEVRHNTWRSDGKENREPGADEKRMMYVVGLAVELETALRAVGEATQKKSYAVSMARRAKAASEKMKKIAGAVSAPEIDAITKAAAGAKLKLNNKAQLTAAADSIAESTRALIANHDGSAFAGVDAMIPPPGEYKGKPAR